MTAQSLPSTPFKNSLTSLTPFGQGAALGLEWNKRHRQLPKRPLRLPKRHRHIPVSTRDSPTLMNRIVIFLSLILTTSGPNLTVLSVTSCSILTMTCPILSTPSPIFTRPGPKLTPVVPWLALGRSPGASDAIMKCTSFTYVVLVVDGAMSWYQSTPVPL